MQLLHEHSQRNNLTMAEIYDDLFDFLKNKAKTSEMCHWRDKK